MSVLLYCKHCDLGHTIDQWQRTELQCHCGQVIHTRASDLIKQGNEVDECVLCGHKHFHKRKHFPRRLGIAIVAIAAISTFWMPGKYFYAPLIIASIIDLILYQFIPWKVVCYVCDTEYFGYPPTKDQVAYDLEKATKYQRERWHKVAKQSS